MNAVVNISNLTKNYKVYDRKKDRLIETCFPFMKKHRVYTAINNLNLEIKKGDILGILGKNGAGKSTLLKMITGVVTPTLGEMKIEGKISSLLELGTAFNLELTGYENIYQHGQVFGYTREQMKEKEQEIIDFADIGDHISQPVKTYSSGMFARLAFACAINVDPDILIVDEVLSVGDMAFQLKCFKKFQEFKNKNKTIIFVTHNVTDIIANCNRAIILENGVKIFDGGTKEGVDTYKRLVTGNLKNEDEKVIEVTTQNLSKVGKVTTSKNDSSDLGIWQKNYTINPDYLEYGNHKADIIDFGIFDKDDNYKTTIYNNEEIKVKMKVKFNEDVKDVIFAFGIKDYNGLELCGTNTELEKIPSKSYKKGEIEIVEFKQKIPLNYNKYTLSLGCVRFDSNEELEILNRKYDIVLIEVIPEKPCFGLFEVNSKVRRLSDEN
jgi:teichoic acid transport system ATP-binding protein